VLLGHGRRAVSRVRPCAGRRARVARGAACAADDARACSPAVPLLARLPGVAVRGDGPRPVGRVTEEDRELERGNVLLGWALVGLFIVLFLATVLVALVYLQLD